jgi:hypothetical protein
MRSGARIITVAGAFDEVTSPLTQAYNEGRPELPTPSGQVESVLQDPDCVSQAISSDHTRQVGDGSTYRQDIYSDRRQGRTHLTRHTRLPPEPGLMNDHHPYLMPHHPYHSHILSLHNTGNLDLLHPVFPTLHNPNPRSCHFHCHLQRRLGSGCKLPDPSSVLFIRDKRTA